MNLPDLRKELEETGIIEVDYILKLFDEDRRNTVKRILRYIKKLESKIVNEDTRSTIHKISICIEDEFIN